MKTTTNVVLYRQWRDFLKFLAAVLAVQICLFKML